MWLIILLATSLFLWLALLRKLLFPSKLASVQWKQYGIPEIDASSVVTEMDVLLGRRDITERDDYVYGLMGSHKFCAMYEEPRPVILVKDLNLIKKILVKDFDHFIDRRQFFGGSRKDSILLKMLGNLQGDQWKRVRASVSSTFTTGKIRRMMDTINKIGIQWVSALKSKTEADKVVDVYSTVSKYTVDVIASAIFGLKVETVKDNNSAFSTMANRLINMTPFQVIKFTLSLRFQKAFRFFGFDFMDMEALRYFEVLLNQKLKERMSGGVDHTRNDFLQLLVEAKQGKLKGVGKDELNNFEKKAQVSLAKKNRQYLTNEVMSGQMLFFFFAGFRTTTAFLTFCAYALALHQDIQERLWRELEDGDVVREDGSVDYDLLGQYVYLDMFVCEVLRKFPATLRLERMCGEEYKDPETGLYVPKGYFVAIPLKSIHHDKRYYDNPDTFDPEHFRPEKKAARHPYAFMPFGMGPRSCIGMRFALVESKAAIAHLVYNFLIEPTDKTPTQLTGKRANFQIVPPDNLQLKFTLR